MTVFYHDSYKKLTQTSGHPESPDRILAILEMLETALPSERLVKPESATFDQMARVHDPTYIELIQNHSEGYMDPDTYIREDTFEMASLAVGGAVQAIEHTLKTREPSYAVTRPPGHHAGKNHGGGFCYFNNAAVAAVQALEKVDKVAVVDMDVHHGNGTNDIFSESPDVLYISTHQWGIYPGTGRPEDVGNGDGEGFTVNVPMRSRSGDSTFEMAYDRMIIPILKEYKPEAVIVSFGADGHYKESLASLTLSSPGHLAIIKKLLALASDVSENRIAFILEGGYNTKALAEIVCGTIALFNGQSYETEYNEVLDPDVKGREWVEHSLGVQKKYWPV